MCCFFEIFFIFHCLFLFLFLFPLHSAQTNGERIVAICGMMIGSAAYAYVVGNICGVIATMDQASTEFNQSMDDLNLYMEENHVPTELRIRLREYFMYAKAMNRQEYYSKLYDRMSPALRGEVAYHINEEWISNVPFLARQPGIENEEHHLFITDVAMNLKAEAYGPQEVVIKLGEKAEKMYIMQKGVVAKGGNIISGGKFFGADIILAAGRRTYMVRALTFTDLFVLRKTVLEQILESANYYGMSAQIRRASLCESFKMSFIRLAHIKGKKMFGWYLCVLLPVILCVCCCGTFKKVGHGSNLLIVVLFFFPFNLNSWHTKFTIHCSGYTTGIKASIGWSCSGWWWWWWSWQ